MTDADRPELARDVEDAYQARREALLRAVTELDGELEALGRQPTPDPARLRQALRQLLTTLHEHVEESEAPGSLLAQIVEQAPWLTHKTDQLRAEHGVMLDATTALIDRADATADVAALLPDVRRLSRRVSDHRHRGTELLTDAYMLDVSAGD